MSNRLIGIALEMSRWSLTLSMVTIGLLFFLFFQLQRCQGHHQHQYKHLHVSEDNFDECVGNINTDWVNWRLLILCIAVRKIAANLKRYKQKRNLYLPGSVCYFLGVIFK